MSFVFRKGEYKLQIDRVSKGLIIKIFKDDNSLIFSIVPPGNIFMLENNAWKLLDTLSIETPSHNYLDKATRDLNLVLRSYTRINLLVYEQELISTISYDLISNQDISWLNKITDKENKELLLEDNQIYLENRYVSLEHDTKEDIRKIVKRRSIISPILLTPAGDKLGINTSPIFLDMKQIHTGTPGKVVDPTQLLLEGAKDGILEMVETALNRGADIHFNNDQALILSSQENHIDIIKYLLDNDANIHVNEDAPLREAVIEGNYDAVELLLESGADVNANNDKAYQWAYNYKYDDIMDLLLKYGANPQVNIRL